MVSTNFSGARVNKKKLAQVNSFIYKLKKLLKTSLSYYRVIPLIVGLFTSLQEISILNAILLLMTLFFLWSSKYDKKFWKFYALYTVFFLPVIYIGRVWPKYSRSFDIELLQIIGTYPGIQQNYDSKVFFHFILAFLSCKGYFVNQFLRDFELEQQEKEK